MRRSPIPCWYGPWRVLGPLAIVGLLLFLPEPVSGQTTVLDSLGKLKVGGEAPNFSGLDSRDRVFNLKKVLSQRGKAPRFVVVSFWSKDCKPCRKGLLALDRLAARLERKKVRFVLISCDPIPEGQADSGAAMEQHVRGLDKWLRKLGLKHHGKKKGHLRLLWDPDLSIARRYQVFGKGGLTLPHTFVIRRDRTIVGIISNEGDDFEDVVRKLATRKKKKRK